jgi:Ca2+-binding EF-hand superfamily protein
MDYDKDGKLSKSDLQKIIHSDTLSFGTLDLQKLIDEADLDGDGKIDYN